MVNDHKQWNCLNLGLKQFSVNLGLKIWTGNGLHICSIYTAADIQLITFLQLYVSVEQIVVS